MSPKLASPLLALAACFALAACNGNNNKGPKTGPPGKEKKSAKLSRCSPEGKRVVELDLNRDKQPDVWNLYASKIEGGAKVDLMSCKAIDLNFDGRRDVWKYYNDAGSLVREEMDLDFDGRIDLVTIRRAGKIHKQEMDTNYDGKTDIFKHFEEGQLVRVDRDSNYNGKIDYWEYYEGGQLDRIGYDRDGDSRVDHWDRAPSKPAAPAKPAPKPPTEETKQ